MTAERLASARATALSFSRLCLDCGLCRIFATHCELYEWVIARALDENRRSKQVVLNSRIKALLSGQNTLKLVQLGWIPDRQVRAFRCIFRKVVQLDLGWSLLVYHQLPVVFQHCSCILYVPVKR